MGRPFSKDRAATLTANAFTVWLHDEVHTSGLDKNQYLDDYELAVRGLKAGWDDPGNFTARKHESHVDDRLPFWWDQFAADPENDQLSAQILFNTLMQISGSYRTQCYVQAQSPEDYLELRTTRPHSIPMEHTVSSEMRAWLPEGANANFSRASISLEELDEQKTKVAKAAGQALRRVCVRLGENSFDFGQLDSFSTRELTTIQYNWATFATDCVVLAAKIRDGDLRAVPFLEPKSISSDPPPEVIYPLRAAA